jgi:hypothetical protein
VFDCLIAREQGIDWFIMGVLTFEETELRRIHYTLHGVWFELKFSFLFLFLINLTLNCWCINVKSAAVIINSRLSSY